MKENVLVLVQKKSMYVCVYIEKKKEKEKKGRERESILF